SEGGDVQYHVVELIQRGHLVEQPFARIHECDVRFYAPCQKQLAQEDTQGFAVPGVAVQDEWHAGGNRRTNAKEQSAASVIILNIPCERADDVKWIGKSLRDFLCCFCGKRIRLQKIFQPLEVIFSQCGPVACACTNPDCRVDVVHRRQKPPILSLYRVGE